MHKGIIIGVIVAVVAIGGALSSPLFYETEVDEPLPVALNKMQEGLTLEKFSNMDEESRADIIDNMPEKVKKMIMDESAKSVRTVSEDMNEMSGPKILKTGEFEGLAGHKAQGNAKILDADGSKFLRFENFEVTNGPDLRVYITQGGDVKDGIHLDKLKGSKGAQNYVLEDIDLDVYDTVVIYCQPFGAYFGQAMLK